MKYSNNTKPGTATVTITGKGKYTGSVKKTFKIKNGLTVSLSKKSYAYTGKVCKPSVTVKSGKTKLATKYYSVTYKNNTNAGTASVVVKGKGKYKGKNAYVTFKIAAKSITKTTISLSKTSYIYSGSAFKPTVAVKLGTTTLKAGVDYTVSYSNNVEPGTATVTVSGRGNYAGSVKTQFEIKENADNPTNRKGVYPDTLSLQTEENPEKGYINKANVTVLGHGINAYDAEDINGHTKYDGHTMKDATFADTLRMPKSIAYDGHNLWIGEFKFSNRLLRFEMK